MQVPRTADPALYVNSVLGEVFAHWKLKNAFIQELLVSMLQHWKSQCNWYALSLWFLWFYILEVSMLMFGRNQHNSVKQLSLN